MLTPGQARSTCIRPGRYVGCCYPLTLDNRGHNYLNTPIKLSYHCRKYKIPPNRPTPCHILSPIHIYLTTSIKIQPLARPSKYRIPQKRPGLSEKADRKCHLASLSNPIQSKKIPYIYTGIPINCLLTEAMILLIPSDRLFD